MIYQITAILREIYLSLRATSHHTLAWVCIVDRYAIQNAKQIR